MVQEQFHMQIVDVAEILVVPVCVSHVTPRKGGGSEMDTGEFGDYGDAEDEKVSAFWLVMLKTRKCYNFSAHLHWLVGNVDKEVCMRDEFCCQPCLYCAFVN
jgi:hypothetical protein